MPQQALNVKIAQEIIDEFNLTDDDIHRFNGGILVRDVVYKDVRKRVRRMKPQTLLRIVWFAKDVSLYPVHCGTWLNKYDDGRTLIRDIAATTIFATIYELLTEAFDAKVA